MTAIILKRRHVRQMNTFSFGLPRHKALRYPTVNVDISSMEKQKGLSMVGKHRQ